MMACPQSDELEHYDGLKCYFGNNMALLKTKYNLRNKQGIFHDNGNDLERWLQKNKCMALSIFLDKCCHISDEKQFLFPVCIL